MKLFKIVKIKWLVLFFILTSLTSCDWDTVTFIYTYIPGVAQGPEISNPNYHAYSRYEYVGIFPTIYPLSSQKPTDIGTYEVSVYNTIDGPSGPPANTLIETKQFSIIASNNLSLSMPTATLTSCSGSSSTQTTLGVSGSGLTASVTISAPSGFEISTSSGGTYSSSLTLTNTSTVSQTLHVRLIAATVGTISGSITATSSSTTATTTVTGTVNATPSVTITEIDASGFANNDAIICVGGSVTLTASGTTASYLWSTSSSSATITLSPSTTTTYTVTGTASGCSNTASITITVNAIPTVNITVIDVSGTTNNDAIICDGSSVTLTASGTTADYLWSTSELTASITNSPTTNTTYTVTGTTAAGCSNITSVTVTVNAIPTISIDESDVSGSVNDDSKVCIGGTATLTAIGGSTYSWSNLETAPQISPTISSITTYTVTGTTSGCSNTASITITVESLPALAFNSITLCNESTFLITNTTSLSNNESWSVTGANTVNNGYVTAGTIPGGYSVSYTDGCNQTVSASVTVSSTSTLPAITDGQASYKFDGTPKGPSSASYYIGYNGFNYSSPTRPTKPGFYKANNQAGSEAGCPFPFEIFRCTTCPD